MSKGRTPPAAPGIASVTMHDAGATFEVPDDAVYPDGFGLQGFSDDDNGFVCIRPEGAPVLVFDLAMARTLSDAIRFAIAKVEQGMRDRKHAAKRTTTPSA